MIQRFGIYRCISIFILCMNLSVFAVSSELNIDQMLISGIEQLNEAYDVWEIESFQAAATIFDQAVKQAPENYRTHYWQGVGNYYLACFYLYARETDKDEAQGKQAVKKGIHALEKAIQHHPDNSECYALLGVLQGMMIQINPWTAITKGRKVIQNRNRALALNPNNPRIHFLTGMSLYMCPKLLGGSSEKAVDHLLKAIELFDKETEKKHDPLTPSWGYNTCLAFIGNICLKQKEYQKACIYYQRVLKNNPADPIAREGLERVSRISK